MVTLLTDFGAKDTYVGQMKGALLRVSPDIRWVDLCHEVPPQDVRAGAFLLWTAVEAFPPGTVHLAVVDPGVGSARRPVAVRTRRGDVLVGPDNGLLCPAIDRLGGVAEAVELTRRELWSPNPSTTFHGRDVFAPVAAHAALGTPLSGMGTALPELERPFSFPPPRRDGGEVTGEVLHVDHYGNLVTNLPPEALPRKFEVQVRGYRITGAPHPHYQAVASGALLALVGSAGLLEISARDGSAAVATGAGRGTALRVREE